MWRLGLVWCAAELGRDLQVPVRRAGGGARLWGADGAALVRAFGGDDAATRRFRAARRSFDPAVASRALDAVGGWWRPVDGSEGVARLDALPDPPFGLIGIGMRLETLLPEDRPVVAVVGSRHPTGDGVRHAERLAGEITVRGGLVVSGLALGIDAAAHRGALAAGGQTLAVLGCGVGVDHPRTNSRLRSDILDGSGTVLSEYRPDVAPAPWRFPARNRIVAGLSDAVVVVEAAERSGALITADFALELGRPVLAVPGRACTPLSAGCHNLLRAGAAFCETVDDVVAELPQRRWDDGTATAAAPSLDGLARDIHDLLRCEPLAMDDVCARLGVAAGAVAATMGELELAGVVVSPDGQRYWAASLRGAA